MHKMIVVSALSMLCYVHNVHGMQVTIHNPEIVIALSQAMFEKPSQSYELIYEFIAKHPQEVIQVDPDTGNTPLHEHVIELCWGEKPARLLTIAALLACGADRNQPNFEGLTPVECAQIAGNKAVIELLNVERPSKQTVLTLVTKYKLNDLNPMLVDQ